MTRVERIRHWLALRWNTRPALGAAGAAGLALLALAAAAAWLAPRMEAQTEALAAQTAAERARRHGERASLPSDPAAQLAQFRAWFPTPDRNVDDLRRLFRIAREQRITLARGDYSTARRPDLGLATYDVVLPVRASYGGVRAFVAAALNELPHASLKDLRLDRSTAAGVAKDTVDARIHLTLTYRED